MNLSKRTKLLWSVLLSVLLTNIPYVAWAESVTPSTEMIPTSLVLDEMNRKQAQERVNKFLSRADVQKQLEARGVSRAEAEVRLASLSDHELKQLAHQMDEAQAGGDVGGILIVVVLVLLIIFLAKRV